LLSSRSIFLFLDRKYIMSFAFFISSVGDTNLAKATARKLLEGGLAKKEEIIFIPLTTTAVNRVNDIESDVTLANLKTVIDEALDQEYLGDSSLVKIDSYLQELGIKRIYVGVPSDDNQIPFQITEITNIPCVVAYEYMFEPEKHIFWDHVGKLSLKKNVQFAVPLNPAAKSIFERVDSSPVVNVVGHLSIDNALSVKADLSEITKTRSALLIEEEQELVFISGTTQPQEIDVVFVSALLTELSLGNYPNIQIRFGIHPGVRNMQEYISALLGVCSKFSETSSQFKIIIPSRIKEKLPDEVDLSSAFILETEVSGPDAASAAEKVAQAVPGALLNESAIRGKPSYYHNQNAKPYLPSEWFSRNTASFFGAERHGKRDLRKVGKPDCDCPEAMLRVFS